MADDTATPDGALDGALDGGCACGALRYRLLREPMFVHCCHCSRCQRETGAPFAHHALIEHTQFAVLAGTPDFARVPTDSGSVHRVARCPQCHTTLWNEWGARTAVTRYVRVGTLDQPGRCPPQAHIYLRSAQPWAAQPAGAPGFSTWYDAAKLWPAESLQRYEAARATLAAAPKPPPARARKARPGG
ncbi:MAG: GFA family protein [Aquabacterium sp.]